LIFLPPSSKNGRINFNMIGQNSAFLDMLLENIVYIIGNIQTLLIVSRLDAQLERLLLGLLNGTAPNECWHGLIIHHLPHPLPPVQRILPLIIDIFQALPGTS